MNLVANNEAIFIKQNHLNCGQQYYWKLKPVKDHITSFQHNQFKEKYCIKKMGEIMSLDNSIHTKYWIVLPHLDPFRNKIEKKYVPSVLIHKDYILKKNMH